MAPEAMTGGSSWEHVLGVLGSEPHPFGWELELVRHLRRPGFALWTPDPAAGDASPEVRRAT